MTDLVTWLRQQLDAEERDADDVHLRDCDVNAAVDGGFPCDCGRPARVVADIAAKRAILDEIFRYEAKIDSEWGCCCSAEQIAAGLCRDTNLNGIPALRLLAQPYASNPGYDESWRPA